MVSYRWCDTISMMIGGYMRRSFPQGIATEGVFCNRETERSALKKSIAEREHVVLMAPRRYGKTSLIAQTLKEINTPSINIDFFFVLTQMEVLKAISEGVSHIISALLPKKKSASQKIIEVITALNPKLTFNFFGQKLEISTRQTTEKSISELLLTLDQFAEKTKKTCVIVFDEFQQIGELTENHAVEAAIRHAVERSNHVSYIFCGSKRHLLNEMFTNKSRPLYHLCDLMTIDRIATTSYIPFLNKVSVARWKKPLDKDSLSEIIHLTENHPYYVNALCRKLWRGDDAPKIDKVRQCWDEYVIQQGVWITDDLSRLTLNRKKIITALAFQPISEPQGQEFSKRAGLAPSGIKKCIEDLHKLDMIFLDKNKQYRVLDPALAYYVRKNAIE